MSTDNSDRLPASITSIVTQKNNRERYSLFIEEGFLIGVSESTLLEYKLRKGLEVTPALFRKLQRAEGRHAVKSYCMRMLARRDYSRKELFQKVAKKEHPPGIIHAVLDELEEKGYVNDRTFAEKYASDKSRLNNWGPAKITSKLYQKGISKHVAQESVEKAFEGIDLQQVFLELVNKKSRRFLREEDPWKRKKKIFDYLHRKGYRSDHIFKYLDMLMESLDS
ncbi:regulatory protein RecX [Halalkalibaculum sp. DA3122]|uniref:regulatory protein RecX n=1 Tax=Halalkalibaculum sp. DA3122 TaxID=3373607 RepID=UPI0037552819